MCAIEFGVLTMLDIGFSSVVTSTPHECLEMIVNTSTALSSFPALQLAESIYNTLESAAAEQLELLQ